MRKEERKRGREGEKRDSTRKGKEERDRRK